MLRRAESTHGPLRDALRSAGMAALAKSSPADALAWWAGQADRREIGTEAFRELPPSAWGDALDLYYSLGGEARRSQLSGAASRWASQDPLALLAAVEARPDLPPDDLRRFRDSAVRELASKDPESALEIALTSPDRVEQHVRSVAERWTRSDPEAARAAAARITDEAVREQYESAFQAPEEPPSEPRPPLKSATEFAEAATGEDLSWAINQFERLPVAERARIAPAVATLPVKQINRIAAEFASSLPGHIGVAAELLLLADPHDESSTRDLAGGVARIAANWGRAEPAEAAGWVEHLAEGPLRSTAAANLALQWQLFEPAAARVWAESLPDPASRAAGLQALRGE